MNSCDGVEEQFNESHPFCQGHSEGFGHISIIEKQKNYVDYDKKMN